MVFSIDYDRGIHKRTHPAGLDVYMYIDTPGRYLNFHGAEVSAEIAKGAGFDTEDLGKKRMLQERLAAANDKIRQELDAAASERRVIKEVGGYKLIDVGLGNYMLAGPDDVNMLPRPIPKQQALLLFNELVPKGGPEIKS